VSAHLWDHDHPYYWQEGCFYSDECHHRHQSWQEFSAGWRDADEDYNCVYRWDWNVCEGTHTLEIRMVAQRKAFPISHTIAVTPEDESAVRAYLTEKWAHVSRIWAPFAEPPDPAAAEAAVKAWRAARIAKLRGELAELEAQP